MPAIRHEIRRITQHSAPFSCPVTVQSVTPVSEGFVRVAVHGEGLTAYRAARPADAFKTFLPPTGQGTVHFPQRDADGLPSWPDASPQPALRAFTVRHFDAARRRIEFDVSIHDSGLAMNWVRRARAGDVVGIAGMRREFHAGDDIARHVIVGDASALPAVAAIVESLDPGVPAAVYLAAGHDSDKALVPRRDHVQVHWVRGASPIGADSALERAVREGERRGGRIQAWIAGEVGVVRALRRWAREELGVAHDDLHSAAYWKAGLDSTTVDAVHLGRYREHVAAGADTGDPDTREKVELVV